MVAFELAKRLKSAGFPQRFTGRAFNEQGLAIELNGERQWTAKDADVSVPTLNELIKACGEKFGGLENFIEGTRSRFRAYTQAPDIPAGYADTPEEAVARLWLLINRH